MEPVVMKRGTPVATRRPQGHDLANILPACHKLTPVGDSKEGLGLLSSAGAAQGTPPPPTYHRARVKAAGFPWIE